MDLINKEQIIENEKILLDAFQNCDLKILDDLIHDNAHFVYPNGLLVTKSIVMDNYRSGNSAFNSVTASEQEINFIDDTAIVVVILDLNGKYKEQLINQKFQYIRVWKLFNDKWKVIAVSGVQI